jgi:hypothetical protein
MAASMRRRSASSPRKLGRAPEFVDLTGDARQRATPRHVGGHESGNLATLNGDGSQNVVVNSPEMEMRLKVIEPLFGDTDLILGVAFQLPRGMQHGIAHG